MINEVLTRPVAETDMNALTVTLPCFTASILHFYGQLSGADGNCRLWTNHWSRLNCSISTGLIVAVLCPLLTVTPGFVPLQVFTPTTHCFEKHSRRQ